MFKNCNKDKCGNKAGCSFSVFSSVLVMVGALNWGLVGVGYFIGMNLNLVNLLLGFSATVEYAVYVLVGIAFAGKMFECKCNTCTKEQCSSCCAPDMKDAKAETVNENPSSSQ